MRALVFVALVACSGGGKPPVTSGGSGSGSAPPDKRTELERRRDTACTSLQPVLTNCAIDDLKKNTPPADLAKLDVDKMRAKHRADWLEYCAKVSTSHQVRVLEVCFREEKDCDPLNDCLHHLADPEKKPAP